jgi:Nucleoside phosphorylase
MGEDINNTRTRIIRNVLAFYDKNKDECENQYKIANDNQIGDIYSSIDDYDEVNLLLAKVSVVLLTANKYEKNVLHQYFNNTTKNKIQKCKICILSKGDDSLYTQGYFFEWHGYFIFHIDAITTGSHTKGGSADLVRYIIESKYIYPTIIISVGICFGIDDKKNSLGDVVISEKVYPYFIGAKITDGDVFINDDHFFRSNQHLISNIKSLFNSNKLSKNNDRTFLGNIITGEAVISDESVRNIFAGAIKQEVIGGEMEGYGLFKECQGYAHTVPCLIVKSICDWAAVKNINKEDIPTDYNLGNDEIDKMKDSIQSFASLRSAIILEKLFQNNIFCQSLYSFAKKQIKVLYEAKNNACTYRMIDSKIRAAEILVEKYAVSLAEEQVWSIIKGLISENIICVVPDNRKGSEGNEILYNTNQVYNIMEGTKKNVNK